MKFFVCDFETTGLEQFRAEPITMFGLMVNEELDIEKEIDIKFRPTGEWSLDAQAVHGITESKARLFPPQIDGLQRICEEVPKGSWLTCHARGTKSGYFDKQIMEALFVVNDMRFEFFDYFPYSLSTHTIYKDMMNDKKVPKIKSLTLPSICNSLGVKVENHHDAKADTYMAYEAMRALSRCEGAKRSNNGGGEYWEHRVRKLRRDSRGISETIRSQVEGEADRKGKRRHRTSG